MVPRPYFIYAPAYIMKQTTAHINTDTKPHYLILDGLRGVAALIVLLYHVGEGFWIEGTGVPVFNHGYLGVDFFFILSGFVLGYAYDDRWKKGFGHRGFVMRRLIRLHPMLIAGAVLGVVTYLIQGSTRWDGTEVPFTFVLLAFLLQIVMLPIIPGSMADIRGNNEMFPLNGPSWSLFFEYIASFYYALLARKFSTPVLTGIVVFLGISLAGFTLADVNQASNIGFGWSLSDYGFIGGLLKVLFSFSMGLLLSRKYKPKHISGAFWICATILVVIALMPNFTQFGATWMNNLFDVICVLFIFPILVLIGASGDTRDTHSSNISTFLGKISYPVYIIHYPFYYLFYSWLWAETRPTSQIIPIAITLVVGCILIAYLLLKYYDEPVRKYLSKKK